MCKLAGVNVVSSASVFKESTKIDNLPDVDSGIGVDDFLFNSKEALGIVRDYCKCASKEECSTSHFESVAGAELNANFQQFIQRVGNPYPKPYRLDGEFRAFEV